MKTFEITKEQILELAELHSWTESKLKQWFPQAFESELEYGKWFKDDSDPKWMLYQINKNTYYGFDANGKWLDEKIGYDATEDNNNRYATDKEVETALIKEAKRRYNLNCKIKAINEWYYGMNCKMIIDNFDRFSLDKYKYELSILDYDGYWVCLFKDGKWAEIINEPLTLTIDEIAKKFGTTADKIKICK